ncbi:uncharacterized protein LTR77_002199 [Saxophila tyrrhenica]|uniref:FAD-binding domain-containing protein n=1 Tax=Saxophila tyrrhenica TaxID=1690608 RepID=A0AAV9PLB8_9PEZI|nr:hypothetical protein LTR77_002199 [Saxophila tyrrhenica]
MDTEAAAIVVGAGPVGLLVALRLARAGIHTTVLEALPAVENSPRAAVYQPVAVQELDRAGILGRCREIGTSSSKIAWRKVNGEVIVEMSRAVSAEEPYENLILGQHELAQVILEHFKECQSSRILFRHRVTAFEQDAEGVTLTVETPDGVRKFGTSYVVGADGGRSTVRQLCGDPFEGFTWPQQIVATNVVYPFDEHGYTTGNNIIDKDHYCIIAKLNESGLWRVSYGEPGGLSIEQLRERLPMKYEAIFPGPRPLEYDLKMFSPYRIHQRCAKSFRFGRILLAGDAAHICNPFGGLGLTGGLLDAGALGDALIATMRDGMSDAILDRYSQIRRDIFVNVVNPTTQANLRRLCENDPDTAGESDPLLKNIRHATDSDRQVIRGLQTMRTNLFPQL